MTMEMLKLFFKVCLLLLCRLFVTFERWLDSNPESCRKIIRCVDNLATHLLNNLATQSLKVLMIYLAAW